MGGESRPFLKGREANRFSPGDRNVHESAAHFISAGGYLATATADAFFGEGVYGGMTAFLKAQV